MKNFVTQQRILRWVFLQKEYVSGWTKEIFAINKVQQTNPITYILQDESEEVIPGSFYAEELQHVS